MNHQLKRREFLMLSAFAGTGLMFELFPAEAAQQHIFNFSEAESLTPLAIAGDCVSLAAVSTGLAAPLRHSLTASPAVVHVSGLLRAGHQHVVPLLAQCREQWTARKDGDFTAEKLALASGWLIHDAVRETFQPLFKKFRDEEEVSECRLYHDVTVLREHHDAQSNHAGANHAGSGRRRGASSVAGKDMTDLFAAMSQRLMIRLHTFEPDEEDVDGWLARLFAWRTRQKTLFERFALTYNSPDSTKARRFVSAVNFYNREDAIIRAARAMQRGAMATPGGIEAALKTATGGSQYSQALARGFGRLEAVSAFLDRQVDEQQLRTRLGLSADGIRSALRS